MLEIKSINKSYRTGDFKQKVLKDVSISFRENEFVAILGPSGSGKTTLLNIVGGLDQYDSGDLIINNKSTKRFWARDWDAYRNNCVGFIFQSYNLISHISIVDNIEMGMTLSGVNSRTRKEIALEVLEKVGLKEHSHKKPNQLSGGQMQRVAIARALANDPDIILADEPTGALDTTTSVQIMELIKEIAKDKLVIMVTHNPDLALQYATRTIELKDGEVINDSHPYTETVTTNDSFTIKKTAMHYLTALKLSFNNIKTKKGRTLLTSFASSIGIIGIALILALSNGFQIEIDSFEKDSLSQMPISISESAMSMSPETMEKMTKQPQLKTYPSDKKVFALEDIQESMMHTNVITNDYIDYIKKIDPMYVSGVTYQKATSLNIINYNEEKGYQKIETNTPTGSWVLFPSKPENQKDGVIENNYDVLVGKIEQDKPGLIIQVDNKNQLTKTALQQLGFDQEKEISFDSILNKEVKIVLNDVYYQEVSGHFIPTTDLQSAYNNESSITLKVQAIVRGKEDKEMMTSGSGIGYTNAIVASAIEKNKNSRIVTAQSIRDVNILTGEAFDEKTTKEATLAYLGAESTPVAISIYPKDFTSKDHILEYLDAYNDDKDTKQVIEYTDYAEMISSLSGSIMGAITIVLIAFSSISLIVSSIMIGIITYISVLERTKEIGILRALGARKKDITRVFTAETIIIGLCSGLIGIGIAQLLTYPANAIIESLSGLSGVARLAPMHAIILITISMLLTVLGGLIPSKLAAKKDPVEALRSE